MMIRNIQTSDYKKVISVIDEWWSGRHMADMLPKLFFVHFQSTSYIAEVNGEMIGFLVGFLSQTKRNEAYIHFIGVHPEYRKAGVARKLYELFFKTVRHLGCDTIRCVTSPINKTSIDFHKRLGFEIEKGDSIQNGVSTHSDYDGHGGSRVLFVKNLD